MNDRWSSSGAPEAAGCQPRRGCGPRPQRSCPSPANKGRAAEASGGPRERGLGGSRPKAWPRAPRGNKRLSGHTGEELVPGALTSLPGRAPQTVQALSRPRAPEGSREGTKRLASVLKARIPTTAGPKRRGLESVRPKANRPQSKPKVLIPRWVHPPEPARRPAKDRSHAAGGLP